MKIETKNAGDRRVLDTAEGQRMAQPDNLALWRQWGPYLSERQWGTVREDYSADGSAWEYFPHDHARSRAYRWGEDGLGGFADDKLQLCLGLALWNGKDAILKERMFGLTNSQGNHGEDVKELYYYLDGLPTHSYMKMLYKYPQASFPYEALIAENASRGLNEPEFELIDTGVFDENRYFDVQIEYAKAAPNDIIQQITITNRGPETARLHVLPQLWFRNIWSWNGIDAMPHLAAKGQNRIIAEHPGLASMRWVCEEANTLLFCDNDTNEDRLYGRGSSRYFKDGINEFVVHGRIDAVNPNCTGTKAAAHYVLDIPAGGTWIINTRLQPAIKPEGTAASCTVMSDRRAEADAFYAVVQTNIEDADCRLVQRQAFAGMMWCKQYYGYDVRRWLKGDALQPPPPDARGSGRNSDWTHFALGDAEPDNACDIISMPDSWEYPWFAAWDLAFQCITIARIDPGFAKAQLTLLTQSRSQNPNGQIPAFEWDFSNVNPPVHAWAALRIYQLDRKMSGVADYVFLERLFHKLMLNFTWWVNREDAEGRNIFHGGFLGLDNIGLFDLRDPLPGGGRLDQCDGTAWASAYSLSMMRIALELAVHNKVYEDLATKFFEHFIYIAEAIHANGDKGPTGLWDEEDQFYYDVLRIPGQSPQILRVRSIVGLIPLFSAEVLHEGFLDRLPQFRARMEWFVAHRPDLAHLVSNWLAPNARGFCLLSLMRRHRLSAVLTRMLDETEFLSDYGVRSVSRHHKDNPCIFERDGQVFSLSYEPGEGRTRIYGGNSNWRGPVWMPINFLIIETLRKLHSFYDDDFQVECPTGSGVMLNLQQVAGVLTARLLRLFLKDQSGARVYLGESKKQWQDPAFAGNLLFHEYFNGDTGKCLGASHQTGWTGLVALLIGREWADTDLLATDDEQSNTPAPDIRRND